MAQIAIKRFNTPDEVRPFGHGKLELLKLGKDEAVGRAHFEKGWKWSQDVKPLAGTASCETAHLGYVLSGRMTVRMNDGGESQLGPGDVVDIPPGHDAWVVGDETCVMLDFAGARHYAEQRPEALAGAAADRQPEVRQ